jgi:hypothetical protein
MHIHTTDLDIWYKNGGINDDMQSQNKVIYITLFFHKILHFFGTVLRDNFCLTLKWFRTNSGEYQIWTSKSGISHNSLA